MYLVNKIEYGCYGCNVTSMFYKQPAKIINAVTYPTTEHYPKLVIFKKLGETMSNICGNN